MKVGLCSKNYLSSKKKVQLMLEHFSKLIGYRKTKCFLKYTGQNSFKPVQNIFELPRWTSNMNSRTYLECIFHENDDPKLKFRRISIGFQTWIFSNFFDFSDIHLPRSRICRMLINFPSLFE